MFLIPWSVELCNHHFAIFTRITLKNYHFASVACALRCNGPQSQRHAASTYRTLLSHAHPLYEVASETLSPHSYSEARPQNLLFITCYFCRQSLPHQPSNMVTWSSNMVMIDHMVHGSSRLETRPRGLASRQPPVRGECTHKYHMQRESQKGAQGLRHQRYLHL